jgi:hypothetical protein
MLVSPPKLIFTNHEKAYRTPASKWRRLLSNSASKRYVAACSDSDQYSRDKHLPNTSGHLGEFDILPINLLNLEGADISSLQSPCLIHHEHIYLNLLLVRRTHIDSNNTGIFSAIRASIHARPTIRAKAVREVHGSESVLLENNIRPNQPYIMKTSYPHTLRASFSLSWKATLDC